MEIVSIPGGQLAGGDGFTLAELLVSVAIAVLLILGVNMVFRAAAQTTGAGQELARINRDNQTVQNVLLNDLRYIATDQPVLVIRSEQQYAFRNAQDQQTAADPNDPSKDAAFAGGLNPAYPSAKSDGTIPPAVVNWRSHRLDRIGFFVRNQFQRQTASTPNLVSGTTSQEAWVWYGHLALPNNAFVQNTAAPNGAFYQPGQADIDVSVNNRNDNNRFATDWMLGRRAILLVDESTTIDPDFLNVSAGTSGSSLLAPLWWNAPKNTGSSSTDHTYLFNETSRWDVANTTINNFTNFRIAAYTSTTTAPPAGSLGDWYDPLIGFVPNKNGDGIAMGNHRYQANPFLPSLSTGAARVTSDSLALTTPCMIRGCVHFIVEYAGSYLNQFVAPGNPNVDGQLEAGVPQDGTKIYIDAGGNQVKRVKNQLDFIVDPITGEHKTRWYGFPRDTGTNNDPTVPNSPTVVKINGYDVIPLRDMLNLAGQGPAPFERIGTVNDPAGTTSFPGTAIGNDPFSATFDYNNSSYFVAPAVGAGRPPLAYTCAWDSNMDPALFPKMLRIIVAIDDPNGRLAAAQTFEYVINLQQ